MPYLTELFYWVAEYKNDQKNKNSTFWFNFMHNLRRHKKDIICCIIRSLHYISSTAVVCWWKRQPLKHYTITKQHTAHNILLQTGRDPSEWMNTNLTLTYQNWITELIQVWRSVLNNYRLDNHGVMIKFLVRARSPFFPKLSRAALMPHQPPTPEYWGFFP